MPGLIVPDLKTMVSELIRLPSVSSTLPQFDQSNLEVIHTLANWLEPLGFAIRILPIAGRPGKANLIATRGSGRDGLVLSGHTDTVPLDANLWSSEPFTLTEKNDRWYGLGSCDMKSFFALIITALEPFLDKHFNRPLTIIATADEESSMSGARALTAADVCGARYAVIGEPTELQPVYKHKGIMMLSLNIQGASGHSSNPALGANAIDGSAIAIEQLLKFRQELGERYQDPGFTVQTPTLNLGCIHGGDNPNRICDHVDLAFDVRVLPGMDNTNIMDEIETRLTPLLADQGLSMRLGLFHEPLPPFQTEGDVLLKATSELTGCEPKTVAFATEAPFLARLGMETVVLGPGSIDQAHQPNEFVELRQLQPTVVILRGLIARHCCAELTPGT
ncbi:MAG: acetylornithine deacetylase [Pseudomonadales bacterium]|jgi:acetylornithine deacetylase|nr:acetylornithine deacetylase [Pseudomonadales bacterium]MDP4641121.1 acetylornithine deacetylase [Pseudomonadales bacterium]MDP4766088.1 acetylornithine deacetylase [Pseudomonadales bacterium]MDP4875075.1 acetylornithine deacetylase [Pseudomonadales bacterium]MDP4912708.1 acetylornithine deacetylase [Pseudomonadales bacterium]